MPVELPPDTKCVRVTPTFTESTVPSGLLGSHRVAAGVWGQLVVGSGSVRFVFDELVDAFEAEADDGRVLSAGMSQIIPPEIEHHVEIIGPVEFVVEFHRPRSLSDSADTVAT